MLEQSNSTGEAVDLTKVASLRRGEGLANSGAVPEKVDQHTKRMKIILN
jgi:hypothetical protein